MDISYILIVALASFLVFAPSELTAQHKGWEHGGLPLRGYAENEMGHKQISYTWVAFNEHGGHVFTTFSNHNRFDGENFVAVTYLYDANGNLVHAPIEQKAGLDAIILGGPGERHVNTPIKNPTGGFTNIKRIKIVHSLRDRYDDRAIIEKVIDAILESTR